MADRWRGATRYEVLRGIAQRRLEEGLIPYPDSSLSKEDQGWNYGIRHCIKAMAYLFSRIENDDDIDRWARATLPGLRELPKLRKLDSPTVTGHRSATWVDEHGYIYARREDGWVVWIPDPQGPPEARGSKRRFLTLRDARTCAQIHYLGTDDTKESETSDE